jgi:hypothetical protein
VKLPFLKSQPSSLLWADRHRILAGAHQRPLSGPMTEDQLAQGLTALPVGSTRWVVDDLWMPSVLLRDLTDLPRGSEAQEAFFRWRYTPTLKLEEPHAVQALAIEPGVWLAVGIQEELRESWGQLAQRLERPMRALQPRWLHLYNQLAPSQEMPGILLSLTPMGSEGYAGTLVAWGRTLTLLRQWQEPLLPGAWNEERIASSVAFLQRESRTPPQLLVWGAPSWPQNGLPVRCLDAWSSPADTR